MARRPAARSKDHPTDRAMQMKDFDATGRQVIKDKMRSAGQVRSNLPQRLEQLDVAGSKSDSDSAKRARRQAGNLRELEPYVKDVNVTLRTAADRRVAHFVNGMGRSEAEGVSNGAEWYFEHHDDLAGLAEEQGFPKTHAITAAAVMSPLNSPDNEKKAAHAIMRSINGDTGEDVERGIRAGGPNRNQKRARQFLEESAFPSDAEGPTNPINPMREPKVHSYEAATQNAVPDSLVHQEFSDRLHHVSRVLNGHEVMGQIRMDLNGMADSREGILNPEGNTAEDSWMHSITMGQDFSRTVNGRTNLGKTIGSDEMTYGVGKVSPDGVTAHPSGDVTVASMVHAFDNQATIDAARRVGLATGSLDSQGRSNLPSVAMQAVSWTEARRVAGKDPSYNEYQRQQETSGLTRQREATPGSERVKHFEQGSLF